FFNLITKASVSPYLNSRKGQFSRLILVSIIAGAEPARGLLYRKERELSALAIADVADIAAAVVNVLVTKALRFIRFIYKDLSCARLSYTFIIAFTISSISLVEPSKVPDPQIETKVSSHI